MKMGDKEMPLCSQTFFVSQRTRHNKLSLTMKNINKSKDLAKNRSKNKFSKMRSSVWGRSSPALNASHGGKGSHITTMDRYLCERTKVSGSCCIQLDNDEQSTSGVSDGQSIISSLDNPPVEDGVLKTNEDSPLTMNDQNSGESKFSRDGDSALEAQDTGSVSLQNDEPSASNNSESNLIISKLESPEILMCPLCWKSFECKNAQTTHMKLCAVKYNVTTKQLLDALELVQRQEVERQSLGLPLLSSKIPKKPKKEPSNPSVKTKASDGYLQLGLALSASLIEAEKEKERNHLLEAGLVEEANEKGLLPTQEISDRLPAKPAPIFLNVGIKTGNEPKDTAKVRRRNVKYGFGGKVPAILRRTAEERERLLTEKVAMILVGDDAGASGKCDSSDNQGSVLTAWEIRSKEIRKFIDKENVWWTLAGLSPSSVSQKQYYVESLSGLISPSKVVAGAKMKHLSQIPGRKNTPVKLSRVFNGTERDVANECMPPSSNVQPSPVFNGTERDVADECMPPSSNVLESENSDKHSSKKPHVKRNLFCPSPKVYTLNVLSRDWNLLIGKKEMSDVTIFTKEDHEIPAHKLVFYVRCPSVLKDVVKEERRGYVSRDILIWNEACYFSVRAFLKFIYCGELTEVLTLKEHVIEELRELAIRYHISELQIILDKAISSSGGVKEAMGEMSSYIMTNLQTGKHKENPHSKSEDLNCQIALAEVEDYEKSEVINTDNKERKKSHLAIKSPANTKDERHYDPSELPPEKSFSPSDSVRILSSPDIFHGSSFNSLGSPKNVKIVDEIHTVNESCDDSNLSQSSRSSIDYLVSLMEKESESSGINMEAQDCESNNNSVPDEIMENSFVSEILNPFNGSVDMANNRSEFTTPKTPSIVDKTSEFIVYPTPAPSQKIPSEGSEELSILEETNSFKDSKRKFVVSDSSDSSTPTGKKLRLLENRDDSRDDNSKALNEREVVDLTLSSSDSEEVVIKAALNCSNVSTIPSPAKESCMSLFVEEKEISIANDSIPGERSYISNVWDDFDHISDGGYLAHGGPGLDPENSSPKIIPVKDSDDPTNVSVTGDGCQKSSPEKNCNSIHEVSVTEFRVSDGNNKSLSNDEEENLDSSTHEEISVAGNDIDGCDLTEKLLNVSLQKINESIFWRDDNEPVEGNYESKDAALTPKTPLHGRFCAVTSKKATPISSGGSKSVRTANVTPAADYSAMKTPILHKELDRYGIKHLKRNQAKKILRHIYNELHPMVSTSSECSGKSVNIINKNETDIQKPIEKHSSSQSKVNKKVSSKFFDLSSDEQSSSEDSSDSSSDSVILEESMYEPEESPVKDLTLSQKACTLDIPTAMKTLIERNPAFHRKILFYEPVWLNEIKLALKEVGAKFNINQLMNYLDEKCITFRIASGNRHRRKRGPKAKSVSLSQPCNSRAKGYDTMCNSQPC